MGLIKFLVVLLCMAMFGGMALHTYFSWIPRDLHGVAGRQAILEKGSPAQAPALMERVRRAVEKKEVIKITEKEINDYIAAKMKMEQRGLFTQWTKVKGVYVDLKYQVIEVIIEREIAHYDAEGKLREDSFPPYPHTVSMLMRVVTTKKAKGVKSRKLSFEMGRFGRSPAPGMYVKLVKGSFDKIGNFFEQELDLLWSKDSSFGIRVADGYLELDPRS